eukprot:3589055-Pyramimonas_sp.AAC.1
MILIHVSIPSLRRAFWDGRMPARVAPRPLGQRNAAPGGGNACGHNHWGHRRSSLWGHETLRGATNT